MIKSILNSKYSKFIIASFVPVIISTVAVFLCDLENIRWLRMVWNYFLAVIPVYMALLANNYYVENKKPAFVFFSILWLLFFPNSIYMLTDFKYLCTYDLELWSYFRILGENIALWILLANLVISITLGVLAGLVSLNLMHKILKDKFSKSFSWILIAVVSLISSFGVYIGRFARLNSWDIVLPEKLFDDTIRVMTPFAPVFILIFTIITLLLYMGYYFFIRIIISK